MSVNRDNSHSWVKISHGSNKFVTNLNNKNEQDIPEQFLLGGGLGLILNQGNIHSPIMTYRRN